MTERRCLVEGCAEGATRRRPICPGHWGQLPGQTRSRLSISASFASGRADDAFRRAVALLGGVAA